MPRKHLLLFVSCSLVAAIATARIAPSGGQSVTGIVTAVDGSRISLLDGRITIDVSNAIVRSEYGPGDVADIRPGDRISAMVTREAAAPDLVARMIQIHSSSDAILSGTVEAVDTAGDTITVLGRTIRVTAATIIRGLGGLRHESVASILPGQEVRVDIDGSQPGLTARSILIVSPIPEMFGSVIGVVESIENNVWTIRADRTIRVTTTEETRIIGTPVVDDRVLVNFRTDAAGQHFALSITPAPEPPQRERVMRGTVLEIGETTLNLQTLQGPVIIVLDSRTTFHGGRPVAGDVAHVYLRDAAPAIFIADRVVRVSRGENRIVFIGTVIAINGSVWDVDGMRLVVNERTRLINDPGLGDRVHVVATQNAEGTFALEIETVF